MLYTVMRETMLVLEPRLIHVLPGRVRFHLPGWSGTDLEAIESTLRQQPGVQRVRANALTGNVLVHFDPALTDAQTILVAARSFCAGSSAVRHNRLPQRTFIETGRVQDTRKRDAFLVQGISLALGFLLAATPLGMLVTILDAIQLIGEMASPAPCSCGHTGTAMLPAGRAA